MSTATTLVLSALVIATSLAAGQSKPRNASSPNPQRVSSQRIDHMKININIAGKILSATLADNATARDVASVPPLDVTMNDLFGREKYGDLPKALSENRSSEEQI